jgi:hypothetical protein
MDVELLPIEIEKRDEQGHGERTQHDPKKTEGLQAAENAEEYADPSEQKVEADLDTIASYGNDPFYAAVYDINEESLFQVGPFPTEEEAEREALAQAKQYNQHLDKNTNVIGVYLKIVNPYITDRVPRDADHGSVAVFFFAYVCVAYP